MVSTRQSSNIGSGSSSGKTSESVETVLTRRNQTTNHVNNVQFLPESVPGQRCNLLDLPIELLEKIITHMDFNTVANSRLVCHQFNTICSTRLSYTFQRLQAQMSSRFQAIKAQMPRRESARRIHPLACECDIIETLSMRLTLLQMSFGKHIERKHCCFFPGEILDEVYRILHYVKVTPKLIKPYKVTDELFDLTTMAMEYFKEKIEPTLPEISYFGPDFLDLGGTFSSSNNSNKPFVSIDSAPMNSDNNKINGSRRECTPRNLVDDSCLMDSRLISSSQSNIILRKRIRKIKQGMKRYNCQLLLVRRDLRSCKTKIAEQQKQILEYVNRLDDNVKKNEETSRKFSTLLQVFTKELNKCKTELQYWRSKSPAISMCNGCGQVVPPTPDDLTAFTNQATSSDLFEPINFIPIGENDTSIDCPTQSTSTLTSSLSLPIQNVSSQPSSSSSSSSSSSTTSTTSTSTLSASASTSSQQSEIVLPKTSCLNSASKRKLSENSISNNSTKKLRRNLKSRHVKCVKN